MTEKIPLIVIAGPTAVGKTALSIELCHQLNAEVINADSLQVYRTLDIGTGKVTQDEMQGIPHHLLDIVEPHEEYNASRFKKEAREKIMACHQRGILPIIVGGTGLYLEGVLYDLEFGGEDSHSSVVRHQLIQQTQPLSDEVLWQLLHDKDPKAAELIPHQNRRRVLRALEVMEVTGELFSSQRSHQNQISQFDECLIVLDLPRSILYDKINQRVEKMVELGLEEEAYRLYSRYQAQMVPGAKGIGYKEWWPYFNGEIDRDEVVARIQQNSRRYAKRQLTWFRNRMKHPYWVMADTNHLLEEVFQIIDQHLNK